MCGAAASISLTSRPGSTRPGQLRPQRGVEMQDRLAAQVRVDRPDPGDLQLHGAYRPHLEPPVASAARPARPSRARPRCGSGRVRSSPPGSWPRPVRRRACRGRARDRAAPAPPAAPPPGSRLRSARPAAAHRCATGPTASKASSARPRSSSRSAAASMARSSPRRPRTPRMISCGRPASQVPVSRCSARRQQPSSISSTPTRGRIDREAGVERVVGGDHHVGRLDLGAVALLEAGVDERAPPATGARAGGGVDVEAGLDRSPHRLDVAAHRRPGCRMTRLVAAKHRDLDALQPPGRGRLLGEGVRRREDDDPRRGADGEEPLGAAPAGAAAPPRSCRDRRWP